MSEAPTNPFDYPIDAFSVRTNIDKEIEWLPVRRYVQQMCLSGFDEFSAVLRKAFGLDAAMNSCKQHAFFWPLFQL